MLKLFGGAERLPDAVVGDMDSLPKALQERYSAIIYKESEQDDNDQTKAVRYVLTHYPEVSEIHILGATGRRADHTIGNLSLLMEYPRLFATLPVASVAEGCRCSETPFSGVAASLRPLPQSAASSAKADNLHLAGPSPCPCPGVDTLAAAAPSFATASGALAPLPSIDIVSDYGTAFAIFDSVELHVGAGRRVSLFSPDNSLQIRSEGLQWPTDGVVFDNWWKATLNRATADVVRLTFSHPSRALVILD